MSASRNPRGSSGQTRGSRTTSKNDNAPSQSIQAGDNPKGSFEDTYPPTSNLDAVYEVDEHLEEEYSPYDMVFAEEAQEAEEELIKSPSADFDADPSACALLGQMNQEYDEVEKVSPKASDQSLGSGQKIVRDIMSEMFKKATKPKPVKRMKKPVMKSGWMKLEKVIPGFDIDDEIFKNIVFHENLLVSTLDPSQPYPVPVGGLSLDIQPARGGPLKYQNKKTRGDFLYPKFLVHLSSQLDFLGHNGGSRITAWVDRDLQTLEEKRREYLHVDECLDQQVLYVSSQENFYYLRHDRRKDIFHSPQRAKNLICEGSNFILMRYLAMTKYVGSFEVTTLYINGGLCRNIYECKGPSSGVVNNKKLDVCKIYRTIQEECGIEHRSITLMTLHGQILKQEWHSCDYILQLNPLVLTPDGKPTGYEEKIPLEYRTDDLQLLSLYLDSKTLQKKYVENYMEDHPEIKDMLADYVQTILQLKPEDVFEFTAKYFLSFTPALLPQSEYFEPALGGHQDDDDYEFWRYL